MGLLTGFKMLDLSRLLPGPYCTLLLADLGMEVLKIEDRGQGDYFRKMGPMGKEDSAYFLAVNRNKKSMVLNLKCKEGRDVFFKLIQTYDIVLEGFRPGAIYRLGIGYEELKKRNPRVILCSLSGYGQDGPYREKAGHDINYISLGGILELSGLKSHPPTIPPVTIADLGAGGMMAAIAILAAIAHREKTGEGQYLDVSMLDGIISWLCMLGGRYFMERELPNRGEMLLTGRYACYNVYPTKDGRYMSLGALEEKFWRNFCQAIGQEDLVEKQFVEGEEQLRVIELIKEKFQNKTQKEWVDFFTKVDTCCEPLLTLEEAFHHPQVLHRKMVLEVEHPVEGKIRQIGNPIKSSSFPFEIHMPPPSLGEHTVEILKTIRYTEKDIQHLRKVRVI